ncbi:Polygalacturonase-2 [Platanthera guangdongensis]|uniref:Polygalacturonase-2 n=1 Tax=Platanthera guangdongensis TaxID=2320717 RepID=A0ABR2MAQ4_9ASPA
MVRKNTSYHLKPVTFSGPCESDVSVMIEGTIQASSDISDWKGMNRRLWILFNNIENLSVGGGGIVNGNGKTWWQKSCKIDKSQPCKDAPTTLTFRSCNGLTVENLSLKDSPQVHINFDNCKNVTATTLNIAAPEKSPNTDGIHVTETQNMQINDCVIATGDDCISIVNGSHGVKASNISCGPGHGISIGSLGEKNSKAQVSDVTVDTAHLNGTTNGVRIKTWQGGKGYAKNIVFQNIDMVDVQNPIIIDQNYCDKKTKCTPQKSNVQISNVHYKNIKGSSTSKIAINFNCSKSSPCRGIILDNINLVLSDEDTDGAQSFCRNVEWIKKGVVVPLPCKQTIKSDTDEYGEHMYVI